MIHPSRHPGYLATLLSLILLLGSAAAPHAQDGTGVALDDSLLSDIELPNPVELAPVLGAAWAKNLALVYRKSWTETATIEADGFVQLTHVSLNRFAADGRLIREIAENRLHYQEKAGMKKRIRKNLELNGSAWIERLSGLVTAYAYPGRDEMEDWILRSNMIMAAGGRWMGNWEIRTRRAMNEDDELVQWMDPRSHEVLARNFDTVFEGKKVHGELLFETLKDGAVVLRSGRLDFPDEDSIVRLDYDGYTTLP